MQSIQVIVFLINADAIRLMNTASACIFKEVKVAKTGSEW